MLDIDKISSLKYLLFGSLYFSEGIQFAIASVIVVLYFTELEISLATTTLISGIAAAPWMLKFIFGPITDYYIKYGRKPFIITGVIFGSTSLFLLAIIDPTKTLILFAILLFISHLSVIIIDVSVDGWAIQISQENERGKVNAAMTAGLLGGMAIR